MSIVDRIGALKQAIAPLAKELAALEAELKAMGPGHYEGDAWDATVAMSTRATLDMDAVREKLSRQFLAAHTTETSFARLTVTAKKVVIKLAA